MGLNHPLQQTAPENELSAIGAEHPVFARRQPFGLYFEVHHDASELHVDQCAVVGLTKNGRGLVQVVAHVVDQFSVDALRLIYDYLDEMDQDAELDVIALCCEFAESTVDELAKEHDVEADDVRDHLDQSTFVLGETDAETLVYAQF